MSSPIRVFSDPQLAWMSQYKVLPGSDEQGAQYPWSMAVLVFDTNGDLLRQERQADPSRMTQLVLDTIQEFEKRKS